MSINKITNMGNIGVSKSHSYLAVDINFNYKINNIIGGSTWFDPYAVVGGGAHILLSDKALTLNFGVGTKLWLGKKAGVRLQSEYKHTIKGSFNHFQHSIGVFYKFGSKDEGCPNFDGDGIVDIYDECVYETGPKTNKGCPVITKVELAKLDELFRTVYFDSGWSSFTEDTFFRLDEIVQIMIKNSTAKFSILGHADNTGDSIINRTLSNSRANAVKEYLVSKCVDSSNLEANGFGDDLPIASNNTRVGRSKNRRVEVKLIN